MGAWYSAMSVWTYFRKALERRLRRGRTQNWLLRSRTPPGNQPHLGERLLLSVHGGLRTLLQRLQVPDHAFARVVRELEILCEFKRVGRTSIFAQAAEHTTAQVVGEFQELFAPGFFVALAGYNNQIFRAGHRAQVAGNAQSL